MLCLLSLPWPWGVVGVKRDVKMNMPEYEQGSHKVLILGSSAQDNSTIWLLPFLCVCSMTLCPFSPVWCYVPAHPHQWWGPRLSPARPLAFLVVVAGRDPPWTAPQLKPDQAPILCSSTLPSCHHSLARNALKTSSLGKFLARALFRQWVCASAAFACWVQGSLGITDCWEHLTRHSPFAPVGCLLLCMPLESWRERTFPSIVKLDFVCFDPYLYSLYLGSRGKGIWTWKFQGLLGNILNACLKNK